jgi:hypothetical protein
MNLTSNYKVTITVEARFLPAIWAVELLFPPVDPVVAIFFLAF